MPKIDIAALKTDASHRLPGAVPPGRAGALAQAARQCGRARPVRCQPVDLEARRGLLAAPLACQRGRVGLHARGRGRAVRGRRRDGAAAGGRGGVEGRRRRSAIASSIAARWMPSISRSAVARQRAGRLSGYRHAHGARGQGDALCLTGRARPIRARSGEAVFDAIEHPQLSSPGSTGRSSNHRPGARDCPVEPGNDIEWVGVLGKCSVRADRGETHELRQFQGRHRRRRHRARHLGRAGALDERHLARGHRRNWRRWSKSLRVTRRSRAW